MNWREWIFDQVVNLSGVPQEQIRGAGNVSEQPERPFIVIHVDDESPEIGDASSTIVTIWVHDDERSYDRIDSVIEAIRTGLPDQVSEPGGIAAVWSGDSGDLADDVQGTILRTSTYRLLGRRP